MNNAEFKSCEPGCDDLTIELQPGLIVAITSAASLNAFDEYKLFPGDDRYLHFNCQLAGEFDAQLDSYPLCRSAGDLTMGFTAGATFNLRHSPDFYTVSVMVTPQLLFTLTGGDIGLDLENRLPFFIRCHQPNQQITLLSRQLTHLLKQDGIQKLILHSMVLEYLHWQLMLFNPAMQNGSLTAREKHQLEQTRDFLLLDLSAAPTIETLSKQVGLNQCKLKQAFKARFGKSIYAYFLTERMKKGKCLLQNHSVTETAILLGYSNVSHFSSAFRKQFGLLPNEMRRKMISGTV